MKNANLLVGGQTGGGKTTLSRALFDNYTARGIALDIMGHEYDGDLYAYDYEEAKNFLVARRKGPFKLVLRTSKPASYAILKLAAYIQEKEPHGPLVVVMEEATEHSTTWDIKGIVHKLYTRGRHWRISTITVVQQDTDINRITKHSSAAIAAFKQNYASDNWLRFFKWDDLQALVPLSEDTYTPEPVQGRHFSVHPAMITDLYTWWHDRHNWVA